MIIKKLVLHNFRVFRGVHEVNLEPTHDRFDNAKPIILFGGLNGAGKTSILSAVRTVLYGRQAFSRALSQSEYIDQLTALIHKGDGQGGQPDQASIELIFTFTQDGQESEYSLIRSWKKGQKDRLSLSQDGTSRSELNYEQCQGFLNELIPAGIADLFFFDGEKIADLAEDDSGSILQTAVRRLLGIDLIARLKSDLAIYLKRHGAETMPAKINQELKVLEDERKELEKIAERARFEADLKAAKIDLTDKEITELEDTLNADGGAWAKTRESEQHRVDELLEEKQKLEKEIRTEFEGVLPLALAPNALKELLSDLEAEVQVKQKQSFGKEVEGLFEQLKVSLNSLGREMQPAMELVSQCFDSHMREVPKDNVALDLSDREYRGLEQQARDAELNSLPRFEVARERLTQVEYEIDNASKNIERAPEKEQLQSVFDKIRELDGKRFQLKTEYLQSLEKAKGAFRKAIELARKEQKLHDKHRSLVNASEAVSNAQQSLLLLDRFSELLTLSRVKKLESEFIKSYCQLARKEDLQIRARINPNTFDVELVDEHDNAINRKELSAGEKQIYAISILEALGRTSGRKLPIIIDTPLGRLDSHHRDKLVKYYFPFASHQVVILSTDTEIDNHYFSEYLEEDISHAYEIIFNERTKSSSLKEGYFWSEEQKEAV
ncbi:DNA sulfur modification protein DndD [Neptuniibacter sp. PT8_73]|uniref:DNA sulfur modification protein DndD n=1 Tax=Neptuniibacter sp. PT8_73 TaxID=3398206 RepID=UPI0039F63ED4